ncbi:MAG TPA: HAMP domain-containing sensor histidine kinase [Roseiflexaceae bacterium]|nr:HAMP domain-containing sensor histidine kinase [Roseiflexaceae bacterium]
MDERVITPRRPAYSVDQVLRTLIAMTEADALPSVDASEWARLLPHTRIDVLCDDGRAGLTPAYTLGPGPLPPSEALMSAESFRAWLSAQGFHTVTPHPLPASSGVSGWVIIAQQSGPVEQSTVMLAAALGHALILCNRRRSHEAELMSLRTQLAAAEARRCATTSATPSQSVSTHGALHNLSNLLTVILGHSELLRMDGSPEMREAIGPIIQAAKDGQEILQRTLAANGHMVTPRSTICATDVSTLAAEVLTLTRPLWSTSATTVELVTSLAPTPLVRINPIQLREVLTNLIMNAITAMPEGGTLTVRSFHVGASVCLQVSDTGVGIAREMQKMIFEPYVTTRWGGSGLGLATSRTYIERMGGHIGVESAPGQGTTFTITLPAVAEESAA